MVHQCIVCRRDSGKYAWLTFHRFPLKNDEKLAKWCAAMNLAKKSVKKYSEICSLHFAENSYSETSLLNNCLKKDAVPTIIYIENQEILANNSEYGKEAMVVDETLNGKAVDSKEEVAKMEVMTDTEQDKESFADKSFEGSSRDESIVRKRPVSDDVRMENPEYSLNLGKSKAARVEDDNVSILNERLEKSQETIQDLVRKLKVERVRTFRLKKKVKSISSLMEDLKKNNFLTEPQAMKLQQSMPPVIQGILRRILVISHNESFPVALKSFATSLHFYSPKAYDYVRKNFLNSLPHPATIREWYQSVDGSPGVCTEAILTIGSKVKKAKENNGEIFVNVTVDDMHIKRHVEWDGKKFSGYEDFGNANPTGKIDAEADNVERTEATSAMVVMAVGVNSNFKIAIGYFFIHSLTGEQRAELVKKCLMEMITIGVQIVGLTFDGTASNFTMGEALGAKLKTLEDLQPYFYLPGTSKKNFIILNACHMLKLVRNAVGDKDITYETDCDSKENECDNQPKFRKNETYCDSKENECDNHPKFRKIETISWKYVDLLLKTQEAQGLHAATKVCRRHVYYHKEKMKVKLAVQVLSASVASALRFFKRGLHLREFEDCEATAEFCQIFNDIFDLLNSRNRFCKDKSKRCIDKNNIEEVRSRVSFYLSYIAKLKINNMPILKSGKTTGFLELIITLHSVLGIYKEYLTNGNESFSYLLTYKLSQDHLELFFSTVRSKGGNNNNLTTIQFRAAFKKILIHTELKGSQYANCTMQDETVFMHIPKNVRQDKTQGFDSIGDIDVNEPVAADILAIHDYYVENVFKNANVQYIKDVIGYIAGFITRQLERIITCKECLKQIAGTTPLSQLQKEKCRGGLKSASYDVIKICEEAEKSFRAINVFHKKNVLHYLTVKTFANIPSHIFSLNKDHIFEQAFLGDHRTQVIKLIITKYLILRLKKSASDKNDEQIRIRHHLTKTILFKN